MPIEAQPARTVTVGTSIVRILSENSRRRGVSFEALAANSGIIYLGFNDPNVATSGAHLGVAITAGEQITDEPPAVHQGEVWAIASAASQSIQIVEYVET